MQIRAICRTIVFGVAVAVVAPACNRVGTAVPDPPELSRPTADRVGLSEPERAEFYHLEEGSEVFPLDLFLALERESGDGLFSQGLERFGFLPDPAGPSNPHGLPVGITAAMTRDLQFTGMRMVGVNCAACHVSELQQAGKRVRLDGAGGHADITAFYQGLAKAAQATITDPRRFLRFVTRLRAQTANPVMPTGAASRSAQVFRAVPQIDGLEKGTDFDQALHRELIDVITQEAQRPAIDITANLTLKPGPAETAARAALTTKLQEGLSPQTLSSRVPSVPSAGSAVSRAAPAQAARQTALDLLSDVVTTVRLFKARLQFLLHIAQRMNVNGTPPGFGRIDAFGGARNLLFEGPQASTAPVSYPHLWNFERLNWVHWDANTTSVLERNIGQALGLGAVVHPQTHQSTVSLVNLYRLEQLARKIKPPRWEEAFGPLDADAARRGAPLFQRYCATCHAGDPNDERRILDLDAIGTDRNRSVNFAAPVGTTPNDQAIADFLGQVKRRAFEEKGLTPAQQLTLEGGRVAKWRLTRGYVARPLIAVWASAPYLHNNSVPTLEDLLLPPDQRPVRFFAGTAEYDRSKVGFATDNRPGSWEFDTTQPGNSNAGHLWGTRELSRTQRADLIEYLKGF
jgi:mono/diheme cytochrome c family protein